MLALCWILKSGYHQSHGAVALSGICILIGRNQFYKQIRTIFCNFQLKVEKMQYIFHEIDFARGLNARMPVTIGDALYEIVGKFCLKSLTVL